MLFGFKKAVNYLSILFIITFALNCTESKKEKGASERDPTLPAAVNRTGTGAADLDPSARKWNETPEDYQLRLSGDNNIKKRTTVNYLYDLKGNLMEGSVAEEVEFDEKGRRTSHTVYRGTNQINYIWKFKYDDKDNLIEFESYDKYDVLQLKKTMKYNKNNKIVEAKEVYTSRGNEIIYKYSYDKSGLLLKTEAKNSTGPGSSETREYNSDGKVVKIIMSDQSGKTAAEKIMEYDSEGNITKETVAFANQPEQVTTYSKYYAVYPAQIETPIRKKVFEYDSMGNVTLDIMFNGDGGRQHKYINEYNDKGLIMKKTRYDALDKPVLIIKYEYEYYN